MHAASVAGRDCGRKGQGGTGSERWQCSAFRRKQECSQQGYIAWKHSNAVEHRPERWQYPPNRWGQEWSQQGYIAWSRSDAVEHRPWCLAGWTGAEPHRKARRTRPRQAGCGASEWTVASRR